MVRSIQQSILYTNHLFFTVFVFVSIKQMDLISTLRDGKMFVFYQQISRFQFEMILSQEFDIDPNKCTQYIKTLLKLVLSLLTFLLLLFFFLGAFYHHGLFIPLLEWLKFHQKIIIKICGVELLKRISGIKNFIRKSY